MPHHNQPRYKFSIATNNNHEAIAKVGTEFLKLVKEAVADHVKHVSTTCELEELGRDVAAALEAHPEQLRWPKGDKSSSFPAKQ